MILALTLILCALILGPIADLVAKHVRAWRRARKYQWPPMRVVETSDEIPF